MSHLLTYLLPSVLWCCWLGLLTCKTLQTLCVHPAFRPWLRHWRGNEWIDLTFPIVCPHPLSPPLYAPIRLHITYLLTYFLQYFDAVGWVFWPVKPSRPFFCPPCLQTLATPLGRERVDWSHLSHCMSPSSISASIRPYPSPLKETQFPLLHIFEKKTVHRFIMRLRDSETL